MIIQKWVEQALDNHNLWLLIRSGRYWRCRRNGVTKTWKRDPFRFRIPIKCGLYVYDEITNDSDVGSWHGSHQFIISEDDPNPLIAQAQVAWKKLNRSQFIYTPNDN